MTQLIAVYGTLKRGGSNSRVMERDGGKFLAEGTTQRKFTMFGGWGFPRVIWTGAPRSHIHCEVFEVDSLDNMDSLEGHPSFFCRRQVTVDLVDSTVEAWMYFHPHINESEGLAIQTDGKWLEHGYED